MSMNKFMHPRNRYRREKPDFAQLARDNPQFAAACDRDDRGRVAVNFKLPHQLAALTRALLARDFNLQVEMPLDRLIPTLPLRLNYVHWLEDILGCERTGLRGIDIGTGSSCIYPLLAVRMHPTWSFVATEVDRRNAAYAEENVARNGLQDRIRVVLAPPESGPLAFPVDQAASGADANGAAAQFDFCMCNPPFFADAAEAQGLINTRSPSRPPPMSASTAASVESFSSGGEVLFVTRMAQESSRLRDRCGVFTSMLGRKPSMKPLKRLLTRLGVASYGTYEFCQGRVMRWGLGWTFREDIVFPMSEFKRRKLQSRPPLTLPMPQRSAAAAPDPDYNLDAVYNWCKRTLRRRLRFDCWDQLVKQGATGRRMRISAKEVTWTRQRHRRRHPSEDKPNTSHCTDGDKKNQDGVRNKGQDSVGNKDQDGAGNKDQDGVGNKDQDGAGNKDQDGVGNRDQDGAGNKDQDGAGNKDQDGVGNKDQNDVSIKYQNDVSNKDQNDVSNKGQDGVIDGQAKVCSDTTKGQAGLGDQSSQVVADGCSPPPQKRPRLETPDSDGEQLLKKPKPAARATVEASTRGVASQSKSATDQSPAVLVANLSLDYNNEGVIELQLSWLDGCGRDVMHQLLLFLRNQYCKAAGTELSSSDEDDD